MKQGEENFEFVKESEDDKGNYIFQKDRITIRTFVFIVLVLTGIILFIAFIPKILN